MVSISIHYGTFFVLVKLFALRCRIVMRFGALASWSGASNKTQKHSEAVGGVGPEKNEAHHNVPLPPYNTAGVCATSSWFNRQILILQQAWLLLTPISIHYVVRASTKAAELPLHQFKTLGPTNSSQSSSKYETYTMTFTATDHNHACGISVWNFAESAVGTT